MAVDRGEPDVRDLIQLVEGLHHALADLARFHLVEALAEKIRLQPVDDRVKPLGRDGALLARPQEPVQDLLAAERLPPAVLLDHEERRRLDCLIGREPPLALETLAAAADRLPLLGGAGVDHLVLQVAARRALHVSSPAETTVASARPRSRSRSAPLSVIPSTVPSMRRPPVTTVTWEPGSGSRPVTSRQSSAPSPPAARAT